VGLLSQSLFQPVRDWIRTELGTPPGATVAFRFDRFGTALTDADFILPAAPELGLSPQLAVERFSDLVNRNPVDVETGEDVVFSEIDIDTSYFYRLVSPAQPHLPAGLARRDKLARIEAFSVLKAEALRRWEKAETASVTGQLLDVWPAMAEPVNWYDPANRAGWQPRTFTIPGTSRAPTNTMLQWRLQPDEAQLSKAVGLAPAEVRRMKTADVLRRAATLQRGEAAAVPSLAPAGGAAARADLREAGAPVRPELARDLATLSLSDRILAKRQLLENAPVRANTTTSSTTITFDACLVRVARSWMFSPLLTDRTWFLPGLARGELTRPGALGALTWLPTAMLAIRNLRIRSTWSPQDVAASATATNFGPFLINKPITRGVLENPGLQIIGWQLERMPELPPNEEPAPAPAREYQVVRGDSLARIARKVYGDGRRWRDIAAANTITEPFRIQPGQTLVIP
jgi:hypothetical protein